MLIEVHKNVVQHDNLKSSPTGPNDQEVVFWKRIKATGSVKDGEKTGKFLAILDMRAKILTVTTTEGASLSAATISEGLVNQMCTYCTKRRSRLFTCLSNSPKIAEWAVVDEVLASGLLHRLGELDEFDALESPPVPPNGVTILRRLLEAVDQNTQVMFKISGAEMYGQAVFGVHFNLHTWRSLGAEFLELVEDAKMQNDFAQFFDYCATYNQALHAMVSLQPDGMFITITEEENIGREAAQKLARSIHPEATQLGMRLLMGNKEYAPKSPLVG
jgi:hypothetical protein